MSDPNEADRPRLSRRGAIQAALLSTAALAAGLRPSGADPLPVPNERAMPPVGGPGPALDTLPGGGRIPVIVDTGADGPFHLPPLPYAYDALEPFIDAETMHLHHDQHHAAYVKNLNAAVAKLPPAVTVGSDPPPSSGTCCCRTAGSAGPCGNRATLCSRPSATTAAGTITTRSSGRRCISVARANPLATWKRSLSLTSALSTASRRGSPKSP